jgi:hypothetical protein
MYGTREKACNISAEKHCQRMKPLAKRGHNRGDNTHSNLTKVKKKTHTHTSGAIILNV